MKLIPEKIDTENTMHASGTNGMAVYVYRNEEYGVEVRSMREDRHNPFISIYTSDFLVDQEFNTFDQLRKAVSEAGFNPSPFKVVVTEGTKVDARDTNLCYLCRQKRANHDVIFKFGWRESDVSMALSCDDCLEVTKADPMASVQARRKFVRDNPSPLLDFTKKVEDDPTCPF